MSKRKSRDAWKVSRRNPRVDAIVRHFNGNAKMPSAVVASVIRQTIRNVRGRNLEPPFSPDEFREALGIVSINEDAKVVSVAQLVRRGRGFAILVAEGARESRRHFAIFHEMTHVFFERAAESELRYVTEEQLNTIQSYRADEERLCDFGAAEFLMPRTVVRRKLGADAPTLEVIRKLCRIFQVSFEPLVRRVAEIHKGDWLVQEWKSSGDDLAGRDLACSNSMRILRDMNAPYIRKLVVRASDGERVAEHVRLHVRGELVPFAIQATAVSRTVAGVVRVVVTPRTVVAN